MGEPIRIFIVDDLRLLREGLVSLLGEQEDITVVGAAASGSKALEKIKELRPEVALIDIGMPDKDGLTMTKALRREAPEVKVLILGMPDLTDEIMACIEARAAGYILKDASFDYLGDTIRHGVQPQFTFREKLALGGHGATKLAPVPATVV